MPQDASGVIYFPDFPETAKSWLENHKALSGMDFTHSSEGWALKFGERDTYYGISRLVCPAEPIALNGNVESVVNEICSILCTRHEIQNDLAMSDIPQHVIENLDIPRVYNLDRLTAENRYGLVMKLHTAAIHLAAIRPGLVKKLLKEVILPLMTEEFGMTFVVSVRLDIDYLQAINHLMQVHFATTKMGFENALKFYEQDSAQKGFEMRHGMLFQNLLTSLTRFGELNITYPFRRHYCAWHFFKKGDCREPFITKAGTSNVLLSNDNPRVGVRTDDIKSYNILAEASKHNSFAEQCIYGSVCGLNNLLEYLCDLRNFITNENELNSKMFLQTISTIRLMQADFLGISISQEPNTQLVMSLAYLDKLANLVNGIVEGSNRDETIVFGNWVNENRPKIVKEILEKKFTRVHEKFGGALIESMFRCYKDIRQELSKRSCGGNNYDEIELRFRDLRSMNHGAFLRREKDKKGKYVDKFERLYFEGGEELPREVSMLPYYLLWGFILSPNEFVEKMSVTV